jgi:hypothetical protein
MEAGVKPRGGEVTWERYLPQNGVSTCDLLF